MTKYSAPYKRGFIINSLKLFLSKINTEINNLNHKPCTKNQFEKARDGALRALRYMNENRIATDLSLKSWFPLSLKALLILEEEKITTLFNFLRLMSKSKKVKRNVFRRFSRELRSSHPRYIWLLLKSTGEMTDIAYS